MICKLFIVNYKLNQLNIANLQGFNFQSCRVYLLF